MITITVEDKSRRPRIAQTFKIEVEEAISMNALVLIIGEMLLSIVKKIEEERNPNG